MYNLKTRTEYSFRTAFGPIERVIQAGANGIADRHGTWGHVQFSKAMKKANRKPVFGCELAVVMDASLKEKQPVNYMSFFARSNAGLKTIYELVTTATENFYFIPRIDYGHLFDLPEDVIIYSGTLPNYGSLPRKNNIFIELSPMSNPKMQSFAKEKGYRCVASSDNFYPYIQDKEIYQVLAGGNREDRTKPMFLLDDKEWQRTLPWADPEALLIEAELYKECNAELPFAKMLRYSNPRPLEEMCIEGADRLGLDLSVPAYKQRLERELGLIKEKDFADYFYVVADMVNYAKEHMLVGPARGSSCGSLVCYLIGITDIDPLKHNLLFERFIDITRKDLPDIDIDFQDDRREMVFDYLRKKYGENCVARIGTVMRYKAKSAIVDVSKELNIPAWEVEDVKGAIIERSGGDSRAKFCILDTFNELEVGRETLKKYPQLRIAADIEAHARQSGQHAAGIIVANETVMNYCSFNKKVGSLQIDKKDAEDLNLLKIDALGLRTLSILQDVLDNVGMSREQLLKQNIEDPRAFEIFKQEKFSGIFQFEGFALQNICKQMPIDHFEDIAVITALARPGPLTSGATTEFVKRRTGGSEVKYLHPMTKSITEVTYGVVVYQEQVMQIAREVGKLSWEDVSSLRKAMSKSLGKEYFDTYWVRFLAGAKENGIKEVDAKLIWDNINTMGSWAFNRSHAVAYGMVSYWCALLKALYPLEFAAACLRNSKDENQAKTLLRELDKEGFKFKIFDKEKSQKNWTVVDGELIGGLTNVKGIGEKLAEDIINRRASGKDLTVRQMNLITNPITPYDNLFECRIRFKDMMENPEKYNIHNKIWDICDIDAAQDGEYVVFGKLTTKNLRDLNEAIFLNRRNGRRIDKNSHMLNATIEDDTGVLRISIDRFKYAKLGKPIIEEGKIGDWYLWRGKVRKGWLSLQIDKWRKL